MVVNITDGASYTRSNLPSLPLLNQNRCQHSKQATSHGRDHIGNKMLVRGHGFYYEKLNRRCVLVARS
jgi:hypothetical protein